MTSKLELETVGLQLQEGVAWITLNRPESLNAFTPQMGRELLSVLDRLAEDWDVRALVPLQNARRTTPSGSRTARASALRPSVV